ncbi:hypothetical protein CCH79_00013003 [Gambusia affinis]|uniref:PQ-loop repeat-containing protein 1 n=1 Tax=Gambusia affinis TaxID=33528 RepID=A0A315WA92_GAMAF|nr:hypothetical protein CCH79_00013003 [Gambusia affinis]
MEAEVFIQAEDAEGSWTLLSLLASVVMVFGGALPYVPQYQEIQRSSNTEGFSTRVCLVLLVANILRIFFWIGKQFEVTLLLQSVVMIFTMFAMLHLCCSVHSSNRVSTKQHRLTGEMKQLLFNHSWISAPKQRLHQFVLMMDELHNEEIMEIISRRFCSSCGKASIASNVTAREPSASTNTTESSSSSVTTAPSAAKPKQKSRVKAAVLQLARRGRYVHSLHRQHRLPAVQGPPVGRLRSRVRRGATLAVLSYHSGAGTGCGALQQCEEQNDELMRLSNVLSEKLLNERKNRDQPFYRTAPPAGPDGFGSGWGT